MATDVEKLVVQLSADVRSYQRDLLKAQGVTNSSARAIERRYMDMNKRLDGIGKSAANSIIAPLAGISAALTANEVLKYADAWTSAKNSLAVAGITGQKQADVLDQLFKSAQANATPIGALTDLFGKAAQASDNLGASTEDLLKFSDGVAVSLKVAGASAESASGALQQLGQLLGSAKVQAEEFNSVNDGARPILLAVANGLDAAGGSVNKLKQLVNDGKVSGKEFFDAFLKGLPAIQAMAANSTQTIAQGLTKVNNALTKYVGETDASLGASQRLVQGLSALADNFDQVADTVLRVAAVIAGALIGRSIAGMIAKLGLGAAAILNFVRAMKAAQTVAQTGLALRGLSAAAGPVGLIIGGVATAIALFVTSSSDASEAADLYASELDKVRKSAEGAAEAVKKVNEERAKASTEKVQYAIDISSDEIDKTKAALDDLFSTIASTPKRLISKDLQNEFSQMKTDLYAGSKSADDVKKRIEEIGKTNKTVDGLTDAFGRFLDRLGETLKVAKNLKSELGTLTAPSVAALNTRPASEGAVEAQRAASAKSFLEEKTALELRTDKEKQLADLTEKYLKDAKEAGKNITEAEAAAAARLTLEKQATTQRSTASAASAADLIKGFEKFSSSAYFDVNHYRAGYGSDTTTMPDNSVKEVNSKTVVTLADADRDLLRRIGEFQAGIQDKIGADRFNSMNESQQAALTSIAYNYGSLPDRIVKAIQTGDQGTVYEAIKALGSDNGGINKDRRAQEAQLYLNGAPDAVSNRVSSKEDFAKSLKDQQQELQALKEEAGLRASLNPLVSDYGQKLSEIQKAQELLKIAQQDGTEAGKELASAQELLTGDLSKLSPEAQKQALAMRQIATSTGLVTAETNKMQESQDRLKQSVEEFNSTAKDVVGGALTDIRGALADGKVTWSEWGDIAVNALNKVADAAQTALLNQIFDPKAGLGIFGSIFGAAGPSVGSGGVASGGFKDGGYTGPGGKYQPAGIVHKGEYVFDQEAVKRIGIGNLKMLQGYADGGLVGSMPSIPNIGAARPGYTHITIGLRKDGLNLYPEIDSVATGRAAQAAGAVGQKFDRWRTNGFHSDVEKHIANRRVTGK